MKKFLLIVLALSLFCMLAVAQSSPGLVLEGGLAMPVTGQAPGLGNANVGIDPYILATMSLPLGKTFELDLNGAVVYAILPSTLQGSFGATIMAGTTNLKIGASTGVEVTPGLRTVTPAYAKIFGRLTFGKN